MYFFSSGFCNQLPQTGRCKALESWSLTDLEMRADGGVLVGLGFLWRLRDPSPPLPPPAGASAPGCIAPALSPLWPPASVSQIPSPFLQ